MTDRGKTQAQLIDEVVALRQQVADLRAVIAARAHTEEALRDSQERLQRIVKATNDAIWEWDLVSNTLSWSEGIQTLFGYALKEAVPDFAWWEDCVHPEDRERVMAKFHTMLANGAQVWADEYRFRKADGSFVYVFNHGYIARDGNGTPLLAFGGVRDISDRRQAEEALRESERRYRTVSEMISDYAYAARLEPGGAYTVEWFTETFTQVTGFPLQKGPLAPGTWAMFIHPADGAVIQKRLQKLLSGQADESEFRILTKSGEVRWVHEYGRPVWDEEQGRVTHLSIAGRDITERKRMEEALRQSEERFSRAFHANPAPLSINTFDGRLLEMNARFLELFGYRRHEVVGRTSLELGLWSNPRDRAHFMETLARQGALRDQEYTFRTKSGERRNVLISME